MSKPTKSSNDFYNQEICQGNNNVINSLGSALIDEVGLGKTIQAIVLSLENSLPLDYKFFQNKYDNKG